MKERCSIDEDSMNSSFFFGASNSDHANQYILVKSEFDQDSIRIRSEFNQNSIKTSDNAVALMKCLDVYVYNSWEFGVSLRLILVNSCFRTKRKLEKEKRFFPLETLGM